MLLILQIDHLDPLIQHRKQQGRWHVTSDSKPQLIVINVGQKELKHHVNQVEDFLEIVIECHLIAAAILFFGMKSVDDSPSRSGFSDELKQLPLYQRKKVFSDRMTAIVDEYVVPQEFSFPREHTASASDTSLLTINDKPSRSKNSTRARLWPVHS